MSTLTVLLNIVIAIFLTVVQYKFVTFKQRLPYDKKINGELILFGVFISIPVSIFYVITLVLEMHKETAKYWGYINLGYQCLLGLFFALTFYLSLYVKIIRPKHYINRFDVIVYALCMAIGAGTFNVFSTAFFESTVITPTSIISDIIVPLTVLMFMGILLIRKINKKPFGTFLAIVIPGLVWGFLEWILVPITHMSILLLLLFDLAWYVIFISIIAFESRRNTPFDSSCVDEKLLNFNEEKSLKEKISYRFDNYMSKGSGAIIGMLFIVGTVVVLIFTIIILVEAPSITEGKWGKTLWLTFMRLLDPGNVATDVNYHNYKFLFITTLVTFIGLAIMATYIGIVSGSFGNQLEKLRLGNSKVIEKKHILILGYSEDTISIIDEIVRISEKKNKSIVILTKKDRKTVVDEIKNLGPETMSYNIIVRSGELSSQRILLEMGIREAEKVLIVGEQKSENIHIAMSVEAVLQEEKHQEVKIILMVDQKDDLILAQKIFSKKMKIYSRQEADFRPIKKACDLKEYLGIHGKLWGTDSNLIFVNRKVRNITGKKFRQISAGFPFSTVLGYIRQGKIILNPQNNPVLEQEDQLVMLKGVGAFPDYSRKAKEGDGKKEVSFVSEPVKKILTVGNRGKDSLFELLSNRETPVEYIEVELGKNMEYYNLLERKIKEEVEMVIFLGNEEWSEKDNDDMCLNTLSLIEKRYSRKTYNFSIVALFASPTLEKFAKEMDLMDMAIENDKCKKIAFNLTDDSHLMMDIEEQLFGDQPRVEAVLAKDIVGVGPVVVGDIYDTVQNYSVLLFGYIIRDGGQVNIVVNPNKNEKVSFDEDDLLLVIT